MNTKGVLIVVGFGIIIAVTAFFVFLGNTSRNALTPDQGDGANGGTTTITDEQSQEIGVARTFVDGRHIYVGEINLPTPCHELDHEVIIRESFPEQVTIAFTHTSESEMCAQVVTPEMFEVSFTASKDAVVDMTVNGEALSYYIIEGGNIEIENAGTSSAATSTSSVASSSESLDPETL